MRKIIFALLILMAFIPFTTLQAENKHVYDFANLLSDSEINELEQSAAQYSDESEIHFIILTGDEEHLDGRDVVKYMGDFYDEEAPGFDQAHGDTAMLTIDIANREVFLSAFGERPMKYLDDDRLTQIREQITADLTAGRYYDASIKFFEKVERYLEVHPLLNPDGVYLKFWFQVLIACLIGSVVVGSMLFNLGGRVTVNHQTYFDPKHSRIRARHDRYLRKTVTRTRIPKNNSSGGGGSGGGGRTGGGRSFTGSRGGF